MERFGEHRVISRDPEELIESMAIEILRSPNFRSIRTVDGVQVTTVGTDHDVLLRVEGDTLAGIDLDGVDLGFAVLTNADLSYSSMQGTRLFGSKMCCVILTNASLRKADLSAADLSFARLINTDLSGAWLPGANLEDADLTGADIEGAMFHYCKWNEHTLWPNGIRRTMRLRHPRH